MQEVGQYNLASKIAWNKQDEIIYNIFGYGTGRKQTKDRELGT